MLIEQPQLRPEVSIRWLTIACVEIRVGDFRIVIDPCIGESPRAPFGPEVIEGADIVLLSHTHWDHITDLAYVMEKFHCPVLCGELSAPALIEMLNANPSTRSRRIWSWTSAARGCARCLPAIRTSTAHMRT